MVENIPKWGNEEKEELSTLETEVADDIERFQIKCEDLEKNKSTQPRGSNVILLHSSRLERKELEAGRSLMKEIEDYQGRLERLLRIARANDVSLENQTELDERTNTLVSLKDRLGIVLVG